MSDFALEREMHRGVDAAGSGTVFTLPDGTRLRLETLSFTLVTDSTAVSRNMQVSIYNQAGLVIATLADWNDVAASLTVTYTWGIGLEAFCGSVAGATAIQNVLPDTVLEGGSSVAVASVNASTGATVSGDAIGNVTLWGASDSGGTLADAIPLLTPLALDEQLAAAAGAATGVVP